MPTILNLLSGPIVALPFVFIWLISKGSWMGLGDGKLVIGIGWLLGLGGAINAIILAFWISAVVSVAWLYYKYGKFKASVEIPFGPYLIIGMYIVLFFKITVIDTNVIMNIIK
jgi:leader peptidase (prepilin peptidase)/N-methyltransferase